MLAHTQRNLEQGGNSSCMDDQVESLYANIDEPLRRFVDERIHVVRGLNCSELLVNEDNVISKALNAFNRISEYYITHPHLDHVAALVINSPAVKSNGKTIFGLSATIEAIKQHLFNDIIWPALLDENSTSLHLGILQALEIHQSESVPNWNIMPFRVSHGQTVNGQVPNFSTVYLIRDKINHDSLLICGDLESDLISGKSFLSSMWKYLSQHVPIEHIKGIVMECSCPNSTNEAYLYGHMSSKYVMHELCQLRRAYNRPLDGLNVVIVHVKMGVGNTDPRLTIIEELRTLASKADLGDIIFSIAIQGYTFLL